MAKTRKKDKQAGVDTELNLCDLTSLFIAYYDYHNTAECVQSQDVSFVSNYRRLKFEPTVLSRFAALRRIEALRLGSRPYISGSGVSDSRPNVSFGYWSYLMTYLKLPYKATLSNESLVKIRVNRKQFNEDQLSEEEKEEIKTQAANTPNIVENHQISDDTSDAFMSLCRISKKVQQCFGHMPRALVRDGIAAFLHSDIGWEPVPVESLDLVTEPQSHWDSSTWNSFFVIRKLAAAEVIAHIRENTPFWNKEALRWALENSASGKGAVTGSHYRNADKTNVSLENYMVQSYYQDKAKRRHNINTYYGNMLVVEGYYINSRGKVNKVIFFPSEDISKADADFLKRYRAGNFTKEEQKDGIDKADVLFLREDVFDSIEEAITVIPFERDEPSVERQRGYGHELFAPIESLMRLDSAILNFGYLMGVPFTKNRAQGQDAQSLDDLEINVNGDMVDLGSRDFINPPFKADLQGMVSLRGVIVQHVLSKCFLGGLDGMEKNVEGRGASLANLRLVRDGRVHKHFVEDLSKGLTELFTKMFRSVLSLGDKTIRNTAVDRLFFDYLTDTQGHDRDIYKIRAEDIIEDTNLPYWLRVDAVHSGASHFGAAEVVLFNEVKQLFGDALSQQASQKLSRMGIKSLLGQEDSEDILGNPKDQQVTEADQLYRANMENAAILGSVSGGELNFEPVPVLPTKDDHVAHLAQVHNPKHKLIIQKLQENEVSPQQLQTMSEEVIETRNVLILKASAMANHSSEHLRMLDRFGRKRDDVNRLKEETNILLQASEGLLNNLQINLRVLEQKRKEREAKLQGMSPENDLEKAKIELELEKIRSAREVSDGQLAIANRLADHKEQAHIDSMVSKARDRNLKLQIAETDAQLKYNKQEYERNAKSAETSE